MLPFRESIPVDFLVKYLGGKEYGEKSSSPTPGTEAAFWPPAFLPSCQAVPVLAACSYSLLARPIRRRSWWHLRAGFHSWLAPCAEKTLAGTVACLLGRLVSWQQAGASLAATWLGELVS
jgi:hypothetical protein